MNNCLKDKVALVTGAACRGQMITRRGVLTCGGAAAIITVGRAWAQTSKPLKELPMDLEIKRNGSRPSQKGPENWFTGTVRIDPLLQATEPARADAGQVTFEPGARTAWHSNADRHCGAWLGAARGRLDRGDPSR